MTSSCSHPLTICQQLKINHASMYFSGLLCIGNSMRDSSLSYFHCSFSEKVIGENQTADLKQERRREVKTYAIQTKETLSASGMPGAC